MEDKYMIRTLLAEHSCELPPKPKFLVAVKTYLYAICQKTFQISLMYVFIGCPQSNLSSGHLKSKICT